MAATSRVACPSNWLRDDHGALSFREAGSTAASSVRAAFRMQQGRFRRWIEGRPAFELSSRGPRLPSPSAGGHEPAVAACAGLHSVETAVDENPGEPELEVQPLPKGRDVHEGLQKRVLNRFVDLRGIAQIVVGDAGCTPVMALDRPPRSVRRPRSRSPLASRALTSSASCESTTARSWPSGGGSDVCGSHWLSRVRSLVRGETKTARFDVYRVRRSRRSITTNAHDTPGRLTWRTSRD